VKHNASNVNKAYILLIIYLIALLILWRRSKFGSSYAPRDVQTMQLYIASKSSSPIRYVMHMISKCAIEIDFILVGGAKL